MLQFKASKVAILALCLLIGGSIAPANAQLVTEWSNGQVIDLGPGYAYGINDAGQIVGDGTGGVIEWSNGQMINLGGPPGSLRSGAKAINNVGQIAGGSLSLVYMGAYGWQTVSSATEWSGGQGIDMGRLAGSYSGYATAINNAGQMVGLSFTGGHYVNEGGGNYGYVGYVTTATEWSNGQVIDLGPGMAYGINDAGQIVGVRIGSGATEWSNGQVIDLGGLSGSYGGIAAAINNAGQIVGYSSFGGYSTAIEWSDDQVINLGSLPGYASSTATAINDAGQIVGYSYGKIGADGSVDNQHIIATEWSRGQVIDLGSLPPPSWAFATSYAYGINDAGTVIGISSLNVEGFPEPSTWAMMLLGFAGLGFAAHRRARAV